MKLQSFFRVGFKFSLFIIGLQFQILRKKSRKAEICHIRFFIYQNPCLGMAKSLSWAVTKYRVEVGWAVTKYQVVCRWVWGLKNNSTESAEQRSRYFNKLTMTAELS